MNNDNQVFHLMVDFNDLENFTRVTKGLHLALDGMLTELGDSVVQYSHDPNMLALSIKRNIEPVRALSTVVLDRLTILEATIDQITINKSREN